MLCHLRYSKKKIELVGSSDLNVQIYFIIPVSAIEFDVQPSGEAVIDKGNERSEEEFKNEDDKVNNRINMRSISTRMEIKQLLFQPLFREYVLFLTPSDLWLKQRLLRTHHLLPETFEANTSNDSALDDAVLRALRSASKRKGVSNSYHDTCIQKIQSL